MPYLKIQTNLPFLNQAERSLLKSASALVASELGKPESFVMVALQPGTPMLFAGSDDPTAFLQLAAIGLPESQTKKLSAALCALVQEHLGIDRARIFVTFVDVHPGMWGWAGDVF